MNNAPTPQARRAGRVDRRETPRRDPHRGGRERTSRLQAEAVPAGTCSPTPAAHADDPHFGALAQAVMNQTAEDLAPPPEPIAYRTWGDDIDAEGPQADAGRVFAAAGDRGGADAGRARRLRPAHRRRAGPGKRRRALRRGCGHRLPDEAVGPRRARRVPRSRPGPVGRRPEPRHAVRRGVTVRDAAGPPGNGRRLAGLQGHAVPQGQGPEATRQQRVRQPLRGVRPADPHRAGRGTRPTEGGVPRPAVALRLPRDRGGGLFDLLQDRPRSASARSSPNGSAGWRGSTWTPPRGRNTGPR